MEIPQDVETMRSFLGLINYLNHFSPRLAELSDPPREICRQKVEFQLTRAYEIAFQCCKEEISNDITLPFYNPKSLTILQIDALKRGLGAVLLQNSTPVMFASRALTGSERNYQNLERVSCKHLGNGKVPLFHLWERIYSGDRPETPCVNLQEAHGGNFSQDPEIGGKKFSITAFQCQI